MVRRACQLFPSLVAVLLGGACAGEGVIESPLVRVDLTRDWPPKVRWAVIAAVPLECHRIVALDAGEVRARFRVAWRVYDFGKSRRISAVEVGPAGDGRVSGVRNFAASAVVREPERPGAAAHGPAAVRVQVGWSGEQGCRSVGRSESVQLRADDPSCVAPKQPRLLRPVK